uniref:Ribosomal protein S19 n=1 Tax=Ulmus bergmanniana TaxID=2291175 RepID=A0A8F0K2U7_9ROSA|nr:ribosomal protein S19 [Ulmus bergmanniana]
MPRSLKKNPFIVLNNNIIIK